MKFESKLFPYHTDLRILFKKPPAMSKSNPRPHSHKAQNENKHVTITTTVPSLKKSDLFDLKCFYLMSVMENTVIVRHLLM